MKMEVLMNPYWMNSILCGINGNTGMQQLKVKVYKQKCHKYTVRVFIYEQTA